VSVIGKIFLGDFLVWLLAGFYSLILRIWQPWCGRKLCGTWKCPACRIPFGNSSPHAIWRRRKDIFIKGNMHSGPAMKC